MQPTTSIVEILAKALRPSELPEGGELTLERIRQAVAAWPVGKRFDLGKAVDRLALLLVSDLALGAAPQELIATASQTLEGLAPRCSTHGSASQALPPRGRSPFRALRSVAEPYLDSRINRIDPRSTARPSCVFARMAAACSRPACPRFDGDDVRDEMMTLLVAMMAGFSCGLKHAFYWILRSQGTQARVMRHRRERATAPTAAGDRPQAIPGRRVQGGPAILPGHTVRRPQNLRAP